MNREYHCWHSPSLDRNMELLVFGHAGAKVLVFPTRDGRFYEYEDIGIVESLADKIEAGHLQLCCVDNLGAETFYNRTAAPSERISRHVQFETYILQEVLPWMNEKNSHSCCIAHGCSLGAYIAANVAFRHPGQFQKLAAFSGRYDMTESVAEFEDMFDGHFDEDIYYHSPLRFLANLECPALLGQMRQMDIVFAIGREDPFLDNNLRLGRVLQSKEIPYRLYEWDGRAHKGRHWRKMAALYL